MSEKLSFHFKNPPAPIEEIELRCYSEILQAAPPALEGSSFSESEFKVIRSTGLKNLSLFNRAIWTGQRSPGAEAIESVKTALFGTNYLLQMKKGLSPGTEDFEESFPWIKLWKETEPIGVQSAHFSIRKVEENSAHEFAEAVIGGFGMPRDLISWFEYLVKLPDWHFLVLDHPKKRAVCSGAVKVFGDWAWLGIGSTLPEFRNKGAQSLMISARIKLAHQLGCKWITTETGLLPNQKNQSFQNLIRRGFYPAYLISNFKGRTL